MSRSDEHCRAMLAVWTTALTLGLAQLPTASAQVNASTSTDATKAALLDAAQRATAAAKAAAKAAAEAQQAADRAQKAAEDAMRAAGLDGGDAGAGQAGAAEPAPAPAPATPPTAPNTAPTADPAEDLADTNTATLLAGTEQSTATVKFQRRLDRLDRLSTLTFSLSAPLNKNGPLTDLASLDGLGGSTNLGLTYTGYRFGDPWKVSSYAWLYGLSLRVGHSTHEYVDPTTLKKAKQRHNTESAAPFAGYVFARKERDVGRLMLLAKIDRQHAYKDADPGALCPAPGAVPLTCATGPLGAPSQVSKRIDTVMARYTNPDFALEAIWSRNRDSGVKGVDIPVYLIGTTAGERSTQPFSAGVRLGWRSDKREVQYGIFVGTPFNFWGAP